MATGTLVGSVLCAIGCAATGRGIGRMRRLEPGMLILMVGSVLIVVGLFVLGGISMFSEIGEAVLGWIPGMEAEAG